MKRKIELFMILFLLMGAIVASWKLSELTANVSKEEKKENKDQVVIVVDPGHGGERVASKLVRERCRYILSLYNHFNVNAINI